MGYLIKEKDIWYIQRQMSNIKIPLIEDKWYLIHGSKENGAIMFQYGHITFDKKANDKPRICLSEMWTRSGKQAKSEEGYASRFTLHYWALENTILAPENMTHLDLMLLYTGI